MEPIFQLASGAPSGVNRYFFQCVLHEYHELKIYGEEQALLRVLGMGEVVLDTWFAVLHRTVQRRAKKGLIIMEHRSRMGFW